MGTTTAAAPRPERVQGGLAAGLPYLAVSVCLFGGVWPVMQVTAALTDIAFASVQIALRYLLRQEAVRGRLVPEDIERPEEGCGLFALAMGKMGAGELNYSSDIDLIVLYDDAAYAPGDQAEVRTALIRATRKATATLSDLTEHGYVFRTDLRLRPDASVIVPETMTGHRRPCSSKSVSRAKIAALALRVSKTVSTRSTSAPPSTRPRACSR